MKGGSVSKSEKERYYKIFFPIVCPVLVQMVTQNGKIPLQNVIIVPRYTINGETVMGKWASFYSCEQLMAFGLEKMPDYFQLGGIFDMVPTPDVREANKLGITSAKNPLVLDIDMNDYDRTDVCDCGTQAKMCDQCYFTLLVPAQKFLKYILEKRYGFQKVLYVFSGKRGMHVWVLDDRVWSWTREQRQVFLDSISCDAFSIKNDTYIMNDIFNNNLKLFPKFDEAVTVDPCHLKKLPLMMHQDTRNICILFPNLDSGFSFSMKLHCIRPNDMSDQEMRMFAERIKYLVEL